MCLLNPSECTYCPSPDFLWTVRDAHLELEIEGKAVTPNEYLEFCLKSKRGFKESVIR